MEPQPPRVRGQAWVRSEGVVLGLSFVAVLVLAVVMAQSAVVVFEQARESFLGVVISLFGR